MSGDSNRRHIASSKMGVAPGDGELLTRIADADISITCRDLGDLGMIRLRPKPRRETKFGGTYVKDQATKHPMKIRGSVFVLMAACMLTASVPIYGLTLAQWRLNWMIDRLASARMIVMIVEGYRRKFSRKD